MLTPPSTPEFLPNYFVNARFIASDMDGTLTRNGCFSSQMLTALESLADAQWPVMIVTGRSAGWVHGVANMMPIVGAIAENGGVFCFSEQSAIHRNTSEVHIIANGSNGANASNISSVSNPANISDISDIPLHRQKLADTFRQIQNQYPQIEEAADNQFRLTDWTFDVRGLSQADLDAIAQFCQDQGWSFTYSTVQCHIKPQGQDKATAIKSVLAQFFPDYTPDQVVTVGDSPNDVSLFNPADFQCSVGVANIVKYRDRLQYFPAHITQAYEADGFCELTHALLNRHIQGDQL
ncbi:MAG: HAD family hydrolase [Cyanobacteria bacterium P01_F01_bin.150]